MMNNLLTNKPPSKTDSMNVFVLSAAPRDHKVWPDLRVFRGNPVSKVNREWWDFRDRRENRELMEFRVYKVWKEKWDNRVLRFVVYALYSIFNVNIIRLRKFLNITYF